jgi:hypothetical protein
MIKPTQKQTRTFDKILNDWEEEALKREKEVINT